MIELAKHPPTTQPAGGATTSPAGSTTTSSSFPEDAPPETGSIDASAPDPTLPTRTAPTVNKSAPKIKKK